MNMLALHIANIARQKEWDQGNNLDLYFFGIELAGEVGEACNIIKKIERERLGLRGSRATLQDLTDELADVIICIDCIACCIDKVLEPGKLPFMVIKLSAKFTAALCCSRRRFRWPIRLADLDLDARVWRAHEQWRGITF